MGTLVLFYLESIEKQMKAAFSFAKSFLPIYMVILSGWLLGALKASVVLPGLVLSYFLTNLKNILF